MNIRDIRSKIGEPWLRPSRNGSLCAGVGHWSWRFVFVLVSLTLIGCNFENSDSKFQATDITGVEWGHDFRLTDHTGTPRGLSDFRGKVVMLFFGYAQCPDVCPATLAKMAQAVNRLGEDGKRAQGLFVTVDPARDTPAVLAKYVPSFHPTFLGLYGDAATVAATAKAFKVYYDARPPDDGGRYMVNHSSGIFVFDSRGRLRLHVSAETAVDALVHDLKVLLRE